MLAGYELACSVRQALFKWNYYIIFIIFIVCIIQIKIKYQG